VRLVARVYRLVWGSDVDRALRPVLAVALVGATAGSASWVFIGIWAKKHLGASDTQLGFAFLAGALLAGGASYVGGHISDHVGRRPMILVGWGGQTVMLLGFLLVAKHTVAGLVFASLAPAMGAIGGAADTAMVADLVARRDRRPDMQQCGSRTTWV
jgi:predicted MFS family arabinose efflux permease